jgi:hypothetical protein
MENVTLDPCQSLALRRLLDALKSDDTLYDACPQVVRAALCDLILPPYSTAEDEILSLQSDREQMLALIDRFGRRIRDLETQVRSHITVTRSATSGKSHMLGALREIETICTESAGDCRKRMGTRVGNALVTARNAIAAADRAK